MRSPLRGLLHRSFLERNQRLIGGVGVSLIIAGSAFALLLSGGVFARTYGVTAYFSDAAGIQPGDAVTVAGLDAGRVKGIHVENGRVAMDLAVSDGVDLSADSSAEIVVETLLGRESVSLIAGRSDRSLEDGAVIPVERTTTPIDITELNDISVDLLRQSDAEALDQLMAEISDITSGKNSQVSHLITGLADVSQAVDERKTQLSRLITSLRILSTTLGERDETIVSLIDHLDPVLQNLANRQREIKTLLEVTDSASHETADLVARNRQVLDATLSNLHNDLVTLDQHQVDLAATVSYLHDSVLGYQSVGYSSGVPNRWFNVFVQSLGPVGVDAILGKCGAVDQWIDEILGTNCEGSEPPPTPGTGGSGSGSGDAGTDATSASLSTSNNEADAPDLSLPGSIRDLVLFSLDGWTGVQP